MGASQSRDQINTTLYKWSSGEFHEEYALIYSTSGRFLSPRSCTSYYRVNPDKVIVAIDDGLHLGNRVKINMEFEAVRYARGLFNFGTVKESNDAVYNERNRGTRKSQQVLLLNYCDFKDHRFNQLGLYRINKKEHEVIFYTGFAEDDYITHSRSIHCDPSKGFVVKLSGPYRHYKGEKDLYDINGLSGLPPDDVIKNAQVIRKELKPENVQTNTAPLRGKTNSFGVVWGPPSSIRIHNHITNKITGKVEGDGNCAIHVNKEKQGGGWHKMNSGGPPSTKQLI